MLKLSCDWMTRCRKQSEGIYIGMEDCAFDIVKFGNMLQKCFNCSYRGSTSLPTGIIEPSTHRSFTFSKSIIETLEHGVKSVQN